MSEEKTNITPVELEKYIKGLEFPAEKQDLIKQAENNKAPKEIISVFKEFPEEKYNSPVDITKRASKKP